MDVPHSGVVHNASKDRFHLGRSCGFVVLDCLPGVGVFFLLYFSSLIIILECLCQFYYFNSAALCTGGDEIQIFETWKRGNPSSL